MARESARGGVLAGQIDTCITSSLGYSNSSHFEKLNIQGAPSAKNALSALSQLPGYIKYLGI